MSEILVSVIVPVYNVEKYIQECVLSLLNQTYKNIEILLIDDGSTDSSGYICDKLEASYSHIHTYHKLNEGLGLTRNYGINQASGKYIMFVDSDDYIETDMIKRMVTKAEKDKADLIVEGYKKVTDKKEILFVENYEKYEYTDQDVMKIFVPKMVGSLPEKKDSIFTTVCAKLYLRKTIVDNNVMFMSERNFQSEDLAFQFSVCKYIHRVEITEYSGYFYRTNPNSLTTIYKKNRFNETKKVYIFIREQLEKICSDEYQLYRADKMLYVQLRASIAQEKSSINHVGMMKSIKNIKTMMNDSVVRASIEKYPIKKLKMKQKIFLFLLKYRLAFFTECLVIAGVI